MIRDAMRRQIATILNTADGTLLEATAEAMAVMILHMLKEVPALAQEERTGMTGLVAEARTAIRLYVSHHLKAPSFDGPAGPWRPDHEPPGFRPS